MSSFGAANAVEQSQRRLAAIMFTDMVGYSALAQRDERLALALVEKQRTLLCPVFEQHDGKVIKNTGDGFLVEFGSALHAARCAVESQKVLAEYNAVVAPSDHIHIRIGLHVGDVVHKDADILGDGVNLAARVEPLADHDGICITEDVARQIAGKINEPVEKVGRRRLKNITSPVTIYRIRLPWAPSIARKWQSQRIIRGLLLAAVFVAGFMLGSFWKPQFPGGMRHALSVRSVSFSPDGRFLASGSEDKTIRVWDIRTRKSVATLLGHTRGVYAVAFSPNGKLIASAGVDRTVRLWDAASGRQLRVLAGHSRAVETVSFSGDGLSLASGGDDRSIILWDVASGSLVKRLNGHEDTVESLAFSADGHSLASGSDDETIKIWDLTTGQEIRTLTGHADAVTSVAFILNRGWLASSSFDQTVKLWDSATGAEVRSMAGHAEPVNTVAVSPDGSFLASGGNDGTVRLWDIATGQERQKIATDGGSVNGLAWSGRGTLAWGSDDGTIAAQKITIKP